MHSWWVEIGHSGKNDPIAIPLSGCLDSSNWDGNKATMAAGLTRLGNLTANG
jgi:hypothetical protein